MTEPAIRLPRDKAITLEVTPIGTPLSLLGRVRGVPAAEAFPLETTADYSSYIRPDTEAQVCSAELSTEEIVAFEQDLRKTALSGNDHCTTFTT